MKTVKLFPNIRSCDLISYVPFDNETGSSSIVLRAPAKINLYLDITGVDRRGYHSLNMVNKVISLADEVSISVRKGGSGVIDFECNVPGLPTDSRNTCVKAAALFRGCVETNDDISISLHKEIPHEAGLAGGSADGAAVLLGLNHIYGEPCDENTLQLLSLSIGTDVPFCRTKRTALCTGDGRNIRYIRDNMDWSRYALVLIKPNVGISTVDAYSQYDVLTGGVDNAAPGHQAAVEALSLGDMEMLSHGAYNALMIPALAKHKIVGDIIDYLRARGAVLAMMSGSGTCVYGYFDRTMSPDFNDILNGAYAEFGNQIFTYAEMEGEI